MYETGQESTAIFFYSRPSEMKIINAEINK